MDKIEGMKEELSRLLAERPALESEMRHVLATVDSAPHMTPDLREEVHALYNHRLANVQEDIMSLMDAIRKAGGSLHD